MVGAGVRSADSQCLEFMNQLLCRVVPHIPTARRLLHQHTGSHKSSTQLSNQGVSLANLVYFFCFISVVYLFIYLITYYVSLLFYLVFYLFFYHALLCFIVQHFGDLWVCLNLCFINKDGLECILFILLFLTFITLISSRLLSFFLLLFFSSVFLYATPLL